MSNNRDQSLDEEPEGPNYDRYPNLREDDIRKVDRAFAKLFTPLFVGYRPYLIEKVLPPAGTLFVQSYTKDILKEVNECVLNYVVSGVFQKPEYRNLEKAKQVKKVTIQKENVPQQESLSPSNHLGGEKKNFLSLGGNDIEMSPSMRVKPRLSVLMPTPEQLELARDLVKKLNKDKKEREKNKHEKVEAQVKMQEIHRLEAELAEEERKRAEIDHKREQIRMRLQEQKEKKKLIKLKEIHDQERHRIRILEIQ